MNDKHIIDELQIAFPKATVVRGRYHGDYPRYFDNLECVFRYDYSNGNWSASIDFEDSDNGPVPLHNGTGKTPREALSRMVTSMLNELQTFERALEEK